MSDSVDRVFVHALNTVKRIPRTGSARPPPEDRLKLYGLYKQSMEGDVEGVMRRPDGDGVEERGERQKWDAWSAQHGLSRTEAKWRYISTLIETMHKYASSTSEARELVAELEFVWDQIKSNSASSSPSSPGQTLGLSGNSLQRGTYASVGPGERVMAEGQHSGDNGLRVLRPVSDGNNNEGEDEDVGEDEEGGEGGEFEEVRGPRYPGDHVPGSPSTRSTGGGNYSNKRDYETRNRKWRVRVESALVKMTAEVAALREQMEAKRVFDGQGDRKRREMGAWMLWLVWVAMRHLLVDAVVLGVVVLFVRRRSKGNGKVERGIGLLAEVVEEWMKIIRWRVLTVGRMGWLRREGI